MLKCDFRSCSFLFINIFSGEIMKVTSTSSIKVPRGKHKIKHIRTKQITFGFHKIPFRLREKGITIDLKRSEQGLVYSRTMGEESVKKVILTNATHLVLNPVEPVNKPKHLTPYLLIDFGSEILVQPKTNRNIILRFPLEIGVFVAGKKKYHLIDIFTLSKQKYTLYGDVRVGDLCRYWRSEIYSSMPKVDPDLEGIIELKILNPTSKWIEINQAVFNAYGMQLFYSKELVSLKATMELKSELVAETEVLGSPLKPGMKQAIELYTSFRAPVMQKKYVMECGL